MTPHSRRVRYKALVEYDGAAFYGFQRQRADQRTVQGELERVLSDLAREPVSLTGSGRTDSGVHALGQVISFTINWQHTTGALQRALNANLPDDIAVYKLDEAPPGFHPRYDAVRRTYRYYVYTADTRSPTRRQRSWHVRHPLDVDAMNTAAAALIGVHDFATFGMPPQGDSTVRELFAAHWDVDVDGLVFTVQANAFLYRMVRSLVGSLVAVGNGSWSVDEFVNAFKAQDRNRSAAAAPPQGLFLVAVEYEQE